VIQDLLRYSHLFSVQDVMDNHVTRGDNESMDAGKYDEFETDDIDMSRLVVASRLNTRMRYSICTRFDHIPSFHDYQSTSSLSQ
jgi:hypothetical protein